MTRFRPASSGVALGRSLVAAFALAIAIGGPALAASAAPSSRPADTNIEAWLDEPLVADAAPDAVVANGVTMWDRAHGALLELSDAYVILHPAVGKAKPTETRARSDWPGHLAFQIAIPRGGPGRIEVGFEGQECTEGGTCSEIRFPFAFGGTGPPPDAPRSLLVSSTVLAPETRVTSGDLVDVVVDVVPYGPWDPAALGLPDRLVAFITGSSGGGRDLATAELRATNDPRPEPGFKYTGQIRIPQAGTLSLVIAIPGDGSEDQVLGRAMRLTSSGSGDTAGLAPAAGGPSTPAQPEPPWLLILGGLAVVVVGGVVISRAFADL